MSWSGTCERASVSLYINLSPQNISVTLPNFKDPWKSPSSKQLQQRGRNAGRPTPKPEAQHNWQLPSVHHQCCCLSCDMLLLGRNVRLSPACSSNTSLFRGNSPVWLWVLGQQRPAGGHTFDRQVSLQCLKCCWQNDSEFVNGEFQA